MRCLSRSTLGTFGGPGLGYSGLCTVRNNVVPPTGPCDQGNDRLSVIRIINRVRSAVQTLIEVTVYRSVVSTAVVQNSGQSTVFGCAYSTASHRLWLQALTIRPVAHVTGH